jgi:heterodisulfide reductase subunit B
MANRPPEITETTDFENPQALDRIIQTLGATAIPWAYKTDCCGASQVLSRPDIVSHLVGKLYDMAQRVGAQAIVVSCQMCQANKAVCVPGLLFYRADWTGAGCRRS